MEKIGKNQINRQTLHLCEGFCYYRLTQRVHVAPYTYVGLCHVAREQRGVVAKW